MKTQAATLWHRPEPCILETSLGPVEVAEFGVGPAVICLHGAMGGYDQSLILASTLGVAGFRYLAVTRPGYLGTPLASGRSAEAQADLLAALLDALDLSDALVMAVSGGGPAALYFGLRHAGRCRGLVLASTPAQAEDNRPPLAFKVMGLMVHLPPIARKLKRKAVEEPEAMTRRTVTDPALFESLLKDEEAWRLMKELQVSTMDRMAERMKGVHNDIRLSGSLNAPIQDMKPPALLLHGTKDPMLPFERHAAHFATQVPSAELVALEGGEHPAIFTHRALARARAAAFLRRCVSA